MFGGSFTHSLDSAGRVIIPLNLRHSLGTDFYLTKGVGCLYMFPEEYAKVIEKQLQSLGSPLDIWLNPDIARLHRHFYSDMVRTKTDSQNRLLLPPEHRKYAGITTDVVIYGCGGFIELWAPDKLAEYRVDNEEVDKLIASHEAVKQQKRAGTNVTIPPTGVAE